MATNEYLQVAAGQLISAATAIRREIDQMQADFMEYEREMTRDIDRRQADIRSDSVSAALWANPAANMMLRHRIHDMQGRVRAERQELENRKRKLQQTTRAKEAMINSLMSQARGLYNQAASLR